MAGTGSGQGRWELGRWELGRRDFLRVSGAALGVTAFGGLLSACGDGGGAQDSSEIKIGWIQPTGGLLGPNYAPYYVGGRIAVREINAAGGIMGRQITLVEHNDKGEVANQPAAIRALQTESSFLVGPSGSSNAVASVPQATTAKMIQTTYAASADLGDGNKYPYHYQVLYNTEQEGVVVTRQLVDVLKATRIGVLREDSEFGNSVHAVATEFLRSRGIEPVEDQVYPFSTANNLQPYVQKLREADVEAVLYWGAYTPQAILALQAMESLRWFPLVVGHSNLLQPQVAEAVGAEILDQTYGLTYRSLTFSDSAEPGDRQQKYVASLVAEEATKGAELVSATSPFYDFLYLLKHAIETAGSTAVEDVKKALDETSGFEGVLARISFTASNHSGVSEDDITLAAASSISDSRAKAVFRRAIDDL